MSEFGVVFKKKIVLENDEYYAKYVFLLHGDGRSDLDDFNKFLSSAHTPLRELFPRKELEHLVLDDVSLSFPQDDNRVPPREDTVRSVDEILISSLLDKKGIVLSVISPFHLQQLECAISFLEKAVAAINKWMEIAQEFGKTGEKWYQNPNK